MAPVRLTRVYRNESRDSTIRADRSRGPCPSPLQATAPTEKEWLEIRLAEQADALREEGYQAPDQWLTLQEIAEQVGMNLRTIRQHIVERGDCPFTQFGRSKKLRRSDFEE